VHEREETDTAFECKECDPPRSFKSKASLRTHNLEWHSEDAKKGGESFVHGSIYSWCIRHIRA